MLAGQSHLNLSPLESPLKGASTIKPDFRNRVKSLAAAVTLTSLVDAFSILVIYLLLNFSASGEILYISKDMELPPSQQFSPLERTTIVKVEDGKFFIEEKEIAPAALVETLLEQKRSLATSQVQGESNDALIIQADKKIKYNILSQVVQASSHAGFGEVRFAVVAN